MPGDGDFNLRSFFRALGIKNPEPSVRQSLQPVIIAGDMSQIVPQYLPPSGIFGGDVAAQVAQFSFIQLTSRAEGGTLIHGFGSDLTGISFVTITPALTADTVFEADYPLGCQFSVEPPVSLVQTGAIIVNPVTANRAPNPSTAQQFPEVGTKTGSMWLRPGDTFLLITGIVNTSINDWFLWISDIPASENSVL